MLRRILLAGIALLLLVVFGPPLLAWLLGWGPDPSARPQPGRSVAIGNGATVNVLEQGSGPPVVLVHGLPSNAYDWAEVPEHLAARGYRAIAYDRVGYGYSSRASDAPGSYTYASNARDLAGLLDALDIPRAALVGWSYGGAVVQELATAQPERVSALILLAAVGPEQPRDEDDPLQSILDSSLALPIFNWVASIPPLSRRMTRQNLVDAFSGGEAIPPGWTEYTRAMLALPGTLEAFVLEARRGDESALRPSAIEAPTLVLQGADDRLVPPEVAEDLHARIEGSTLVMIPGGSHMLPITHPARVAREIDDFLRGE